MTLHAVNRLPYPDQEEAQLARALRFGLRETASFVSLSDLQVSAAYGNAVWYDEEELPQDVFTDTEEPYNVEYMGFNDVVGDPTHLGVPLQPAVIGLPGLRHIQFQRTSDGAYDRDSFYFVSNQLLPGRVVMADFRIDIPIFHTPTTAPAAAIPYLPAEMDYTGFMCGMVYGPTRQALFAFFLHDGVNGTIRVAGPDLGGVRSPDVTLATIPWTAGTLYGLKFVWNPDRGQVFLYVDNTGDWRNAEDELLVAINIEDINELLPGIVFGRQRYYDSVLSSTAIIGFDGFLQNDEAHVYLFGPQTAGADLIRDGAPINGVPVNWTGDSFLEVDVSALPENQDSPWFRPSLGVYPQFPAAFSFDETAVGDDGLELRKLDESKVNFYFRQEPELIGLLDAYGMVEFLAKIDTPSRYGVSADGAGFRLTFTDRSLELGILADGNVGILSPSGIPEASTSYWSNLGDPVDMTVFHRLRLLMNKDRGMVDLYVDDEIEPRLSVAQALANFPLPDVGWPENVSFGLSRVQSSKSTLTVQGMGYGLHMESYEALDALLPPVSPTPWAIEQFSGTATTSIVTDPLTSAKRVQIDDPSFSILSSGWYLFHRPLPAISLIPYCQTDFRMRITEWLSPEGKVNSASSWAGAGVSIFNGTRWLYLTFVSSRGEKFLVVPGEDIDEDISDAISQNSAGRAISAAVDWSADHEYRLVWDNTTVQVFVDGVLALQLDSPVLPLTSLFGWAGPPSTFFGSMAPTAASKSEWRYVRIFYSRGYDFALDQDEVYTDELKEAIYGGFGNVIIEAGSV